MTTSPHRVLRRFQARLTEQTKQVKAILDAIEKPLNSVSRLLNYWGQDTTVDRDSLARNLATASREALNGLKVTFADPKRQDAAKSFLTRIKNLTKMISEWAHVSSWEELEPILKKQQTKAKTISQKYREYSEEAIGLIAYFDTEYEGTMNVGPWTVSLFTSKNGDWTDANIGKLQHILQTTSKVLSRVGASSAIGGSVFAYPTEALPGASPSPGALATFNIPTGRIAIAVAGDVDDVVAHLTHEVGHKVYFKDLSSNARDEWKAFFESESGTPDVDSIIQAWEAYANSPDYWAQKYGRYTAYFAIELKKTNPDMLLWLEMIAGKLPNTEDLDKVTGSPKKGSKPGLDVLLENRSKLKVFLHPVSAYSGKDADECFAEVFSFYAVEGPGRVPEIVREVFRRVMPKIRSASVDLERDAL